MVYRRYYLPKKYTGNTNGTHFLLERYLLSSSITAIRYANPTTYESKTVENIRIPGFRIRCVPKITVGLTRIFKFEQSLIPIWVWQYDVYPGEVFLNFGESWSYTIPNIRLYEIWYDWNIKEYIYGSITVTMSLTKNITVIGNEPFCTELTVTYSQSVFREDSPFSPCVFSADVYVQRINVNSYNGTPPYTMQDLINVLEEIANNWNPNKEFEVKIALYDSDETIDELIKRRLYLMTYTTIQYLDKNWFQDGAIRLAAEEDIQYYWQNIWRFMAEGMSGGEASRQLYLRLGSQSISLL